MSEKRVNELKELNDKIFDKLLRGERIEEPTTVKFPVPMEFNMESPQNIIFHVLTGGELDNSTGISVISLTFENRHDLAHIQGMNSEYYRALSNYYGQLADKMEGF